MSPGQVTLGRVATEALSGPARVVKAIPLYGRGDVVRAWTVVDRDVYEWASGFRWYLKDGYAARNSARTPGDRGSNRTIFLHREVLGLEPGDGVKTDHKNRDKLCNLRSNLRRCTQALNVQNVDGSGYRGSSSRFRGVSFHKATGKWCAYGQVGGKFTWLGLHADEDQAARVAAEWRGENLPFSTN